MPATIYLCPNCDKEFEEAWTAQGRILCSHCQHSFTLRELRKAAALKKWPPGSVVAGYQITDLIGAGGMSQVFRATQQGSEQIVALKLMQKEGRSESDVAGFMREIEMAQALDHPGLVKLLDSGEDGDVLYLAMEYIKGEPLDWRLRRRRAALPEIEALHLIRQVTVSLQYAWDEHQISHRDVKPGNIMVDRQNRAKLLDLGIARRLNRMDLEDDEETIGLAVGTPYYMSPEQARAKQDLDFRTDMYSLGATLYHLVTGRVPFFSEEIALILRQHIASPCPSPSFFNEDLSEGCESLIMTLMAKQRSARYPTWQAVIDEIDIVLGMRENADEKAPSTSLGNLMDEEQEDIMEGIPSGAPKTRVLSEQEQESLAVAIETMNAMKSQSPAEETRLVPAVVPDLMRRQWRLLALIITLSILSLVLLVVMILTR